MSQSSNKKVEEQTVSNPKSSVEDDAIADLRDALNRLRIPEQQQASILEQLFAPSLSSLAANAPATATGAVVVAFVSAALVFLSLLCLRSCLSLSLPFCMFVGTLAFAFVCC